MNNNFNKPPFGNQPFPPAAGFQPGTFVQGGQQTGQPAFNIPQGSQQGGNQMNQQGPQGGAIQFGQPIGGGDRGTAVGFQLKPMGPQTGQTQQSPGVFPGAQKQGGNAPFPAQPQGGNAQFQPQNGNAQFQPQGGNAPFPAQPLGGNVPFVPQPQGGNVPFVPQPQGGNAQFSQPPLAPFGFGVIPGADRTTQFNQTIGNKGQMNNIQGGFPFAQPFRQNDAQPYPKKDIKTIADKEELVANLNRYIESNNFAYAAECLIDIINNDIRVSTE